LNTGTKEKLRDELKKKYEGLYVSGPAQELLDKDPEAFKKLCNGVGSKVNWLPSLGWVGDWICSTIYFFTPNTIWITLNITPSSDLHDVDYVVPGRFASRKEALEWKEESDERMHDNVKIQILRCNSWKWIERARLIRAGNYYKLLSSMGEKSFLAGKIIEDEVIQPQQD